MNIVEYCTEAHLCIPVYRVLNKISTMYSKAVFWILHTQHI